MSPTESHLPPAPKRDAGSFGAVAPKVLAKAKRQRQRYISLQLRALGLPVTEVATAADADFLPVAQGLLLNYQEMARHLMDYRAPVDQRIESFLQSHFSDLQLAKPLRLPAWPFMADQHGIARELSIPANGHEFSNDILSSYRVANGVLNNPKSDRRTTKGTFHVTAGGLPVPGDKREVPRQTFAALFQAAVNPPRESLLLPYTAEQAEPAYTFVSLLLRPIVCPAVPGYTCEKSMEVRFFAPGSLVSNLDFVESIFGNAGDPYIPQNDAALDVDHWTGHTGCVILAPHLTQLRKKDVGLPHESQATERQRRDGMCWKSDDELYNDGVAFKLTCRTTEGVIVTLIADNYYGYCKKEVKTQIGYAANLMGNVEEEHAGGAIAYPSYNLGDEYLPRLRERGTHTFDEMVRRYASLMNLQPEGYGIDKRWPNLIYVHQDTHFSLLDQTLSFPRPDGGTASLPLEPGKVYMTPTGYKVQMKKHPNAPSWRLVGTIGQGVFCHKPCTVSGGGKSEISKSIIDYMRFEPIFVQNLTEDFERVEEIFNRDYSTRWRDPAMAKRRGDVSRPVLSGNRTLGSVVKLLTPSLEYNDEFNDWLEKIPSHIYAMVLIIKRFYNPSSNKNWRDEFTVDIVNGSPSHELKYKERKLIGTYLRVGYENAWRVFKVRQDFAAAEKVQTEDDISASVVVPAKYICSVPPSRTAMSHKYLINCEFRLFQRPDDAIFRGLDKQTEWDMALANNFLSNYQPLNVAEVQQLTRKIVDFEQFTPPMQNLLSQFADPEQTSFKYAVCSANPRLVDGEPTKNPRYLQDRPDLVRRFETYVAEMGTRFWNRLELSVPVMQPVDAVLFGRRNNRPEPESGIRGLSVYSPIHYQELPELFMDFIASLSGKSPSTTGAGSEGALTKGPFNALRPTADLNAALISYILTDLKGFSTPAGWVGTKIKVEHDISLLIPEIWCRLTPEEREPAYMMEQGFLERVADEQLPSGEMVPSSRLGWRITTEFVRRCFGRVFDSPSRVFDKAILRPETQDRAAYLDGVKHIAEAHQRVAQQYIDDGSIKEACPPLRELLKLMAAGPAADERRHDPEFRKLFTRESLLASDWYHDRLRVRQQRDIALWSRHVNALKAALAKPYFERVAASMNLRDRLARAERTLAHVSQPAYLEELVGTLGADPLAEEE